MSVITGYENVKAVLADGRFAVPEPGPPGPRGSVSWLRASVCRFSNGELHDARLADVVEQLGVLCQADLRSDARDRAAAAISAGGRRDLADGAQDLLTRRVPVETLATALGFEDAPAAAGHVIALASGYFPGSAAEAESLADVALGALLAMIAGSAETAVAQVTVMVQACDATGALITRSLRCLEEAGDDGSEWPTAALLAEVIRHFPPARLSRRWARAEAAEHGVKKGDEVLCDIESANHDPAVFETPGIFDPLRQQPANLTFGYGIRPCPARAHAVALASGVIDAWRERRDDVVR